MVPPQNTHLAIRTTLNQGASILLDKLIGVQKNYGKSSQPSLVVNSTVIAKDLQLINMGRFIFPAIHFGDIALTTLSRLKAIISAVFTTNICRKLAIPADQNRNGHLPASVACLSGISWYIPTAV
ncbi:MAG: hypothetical protein PHR94_08700 [Methylomonas lenta]|nr:hypothetical protein [Methylomonas lenta]